jgi:hypothetical protein
MRVRTWSVLASATLFAAIGCANSTSVSGTITLDGEPLKQGSITFIPADGTSQTASSLIKDGKFEAKVPFGKHRIDIRSPKVIGKKPMYDTPDSPMVDEVEERVPSQYNTEGKEFRDVDSQTTQLDFDIKSK